MAHIMRKCAFLCGCLGGRNHSVRATLCFCEASALLLRVMRRPDGGTPLGAAGDMTTTDRQSRTARGRHGPGTRATEPGNAAGGAAHTRRGEARGVREVDDEGVEHEHPDADVPRVRGGNVGRRRAKGYGHP